ncbi:hypothetical protein J1N35_008061 [Gossypium stocksii]|uniref:Uncharacterized protein n=1 Tax=Gossypium stocksii TaxID=47602 RepID=A0A9D3W8L0_9ROSI|nr:hypothetical protein J1N35_008061 [Gossypium stocksii]
MTIDTANRKETIVKVDDRSNKCSIVFTTSDIINGGGGNFWRESSYDFFQDSGKINTDWKKEIVDMNSSSSGSNSNRSEVFYFMQSKQGAMEDPPSKLSSCISKKLQRKSNLLVTKTKSRLIDPLTPEKGEPRSARAGTGKSGRRSRFLGKTMEEEEDDP